MNTGVELIKLIHLKKDFLSAEILRLQAKRDELEDKIDFHEHITAEWVAEGGFQSANSVASIVAGENSELENANQRIELVQRERLQLSLTIQSLLR